MMSLSAQEEVVLAHWINVAAVARAAFAELADPQMLALAEESERQAAILESKRATE